MQIHGHINRAAQNSLTVSWMFKQLSRTDENETMFMDWMRSSLDPSMNEHARSGEMLMMITAVNACDHRKYLKTKTANILAICSQPITSLHCLLSQRYKTHHYICLLSQNHEYNDNIMTLNIYSAIFTQLNTSCSFKKPHKMSFMFGLLVMFWCLLL